MDENVPDMGPHASGQPSVPRFEVASYRPDGGCPPVGFLLAAGISAAAALVGAWLVSFIGQWLYLILVFPLALGLAVGAVGAYGVKRGKLRSDWCASALGFLAGCLAMTAVHYFDYQRSLDNAEKDLPGARQFWAIQGKTFLHYIDLAAEQGVQIGRVGHGNGMNLGYVGSLIYWALEVLGVGVLALVMMRSAAREPFCTVCNTWKVERKLGQVSMPAFVVRDAIVSGEIVKLADADFADIKGRMVIKAAVCPRCQEQAPVDVRLEEVTVTSKGEQKSQLAHTTYPGQAIAVLESLAFPSAAVNAAPPPEPPPEAGAPGKLPSGD
jgi:hypothetical protein